MASVRIPRNPSLVYLVVLTIMLSSRMASAETIRYSMKGTVALINIDNTFPNSVGGIAMGSPFEASFTFDKSIPDGFPDNPTVGSYVQAVPPFALSITMGGLTLSTPADAFALVQVENHEPFGGLDALSISANPLAMSSGWSITNHVSNSPAANFIFRDFSGQALNSKRLSDLPVIDLSKFPQSAFLNSFDVTLLGAGETLLFPGGSVTAAESMDIFLTVEELTATTLPSINVLIDIHPGSFPNSIQPQSNEVIPVATLTTPDFDATTVDPLSVTFGPNGATESHARGHIEDVDGDGDNDLVLHFDTQQTGIKCGDTSASLTGTTLNGQTITGSDSIRTVRCK